MHSVSVNIKFTSSSDANDVIGKLTSFKTPKKFQNINERKGFYSRFSSTNVLQVS